MKKFDTKRITEWFQKQGEKWLTLAKRTRVAVLIAVFVVLGTAIIGTVLLNRRSSGYKEIFPGMASGEAAEVYSTLQEMGATPQIDSRQRVYVPEDQWDALIFELNSRGYPKTTLTYDVFTSASGFTATEFEKRVALVHQAQDRMQDTLKRQPGVLDAVVTFYVPETSNFLWDQNNQQKSTANVSIMMDEDAELSAERVTAIKHMAATTVPKLDPEDVTVIDMATGVEMMGADQLSQTDTQARILDLQEQYAQRLEKKVRDLLRTTYPEGVTAVATVQLNFDKLVTETKQYQALDGGDGGGVRKHYEEGWTRTGTDATGGLVGEENNTDVPQYPFDNDDGPTTTSDYNQLIDYDNSYILTQLESNPSLRSASVAVVVPDNQFTNQKQDTLENLVAMALNLDEDDVMVTNNALGGAGDEDNEPNEPDTPSGNFFDRLTQRQRLILLIAAGLLLLLIIIIILIVMLSGRKKRKADAEQRAMEQAALAQRAEMDRAIEEHKKKIQDEAMATVRKPEENAIAEEVRNFAEENPEVTASLIRAMMREEK